MMWTVEEKNETCFVKNMALGGRGLWDLRLFTWTCLLLVETDELQNWAKFSPVLYYFMFMFFVHYVKSLPCTSVFSCTVHIPSLPFLSSSVSIDQWIGRMRVLVSRGQGCSTSPRFKLFLLSSPSLLQLVKAVVFLFTNIDVSPYQHQVSTDSKKVM